MSSILDLFFRTVADVPVCCGIWLLLAVGVVTILLVLNRCNRQVG